MFNAAQSLVSKRNITFPFLESLGKETSPRKSIESTAMIFTEGFSEVAIENWPESDLNP